MSGISVLIKETPEGLTYPLACEAAAKKMLHPVNQEEGSHQTMCHPDFGLPASRTVENTFLLFISHLLYSTFVITAQWTKTHYDRTLPLK